MNTKYCLSILDYLVIADFTKYLGDDKIRKPYYDLDLLLLLEEMLLIILG